MTNDHREEAALHCARLCAIPAPIPLAVLQINSKHTRAANCRRPVLRRAAPNLNTVYFPMSQLLRSPTKTDWRSCAVLHWWTSKARIFTILHEAVVDSSCNGSSPSSGSRDIPEIVFCLQSNANRNNVPHVGDPVCSLFPCSLFATSSHASQEVFLFVTQFAAAIMHLSSAQRHPGCESFFQFAFRNQRKPSCLRKSNNNSSLTKKFEDHADW